MVFQAGSFQSLHCEDTMRWTQEEALGMAMVEYPCVWVGVMVGCRTKVIATKLNLTGKKNMQ